MHAVRARPLPAIKNNVEPDEQREEADTIPTRGVNPETPPLRAYALRYALLSAYAASLRSVAPGSGLLFPRAGASLSRRRAQPEDGTPLPKLFRPHAGAIKFGGHSPAGTIFFSPLGGAQKFGSLTLADSPPQIPICGGTRVFRDAHIVNNGLTGFIV